MSSENKYLKVQGKAARQPFFQKPGILISLGVLAIILLGTLLLSLPFSSKDGEWLSFPDAFFTATSAVCVTGLAVVETAVHFTVFGQVVVLLLIQAGGLGFMTMTSLLFFAIGKKITLKERLALQEAYNQNELQGVVRLTRMVIIMTFLIELAGAVTLCFSFIPEFGVGKGIYYSIFHAVSAFCNAGFDLMGVIRPGGSLTSFQTDIVVNIAIMSLITLGGLGFAVINDVVKKRKFHHLMFQTKAVLLFSLGLFVFGTLFFTISEWNNPATFGPLSPGQKILAAMFQTVTPRTAGFATVDQAGLTDAGRMLTILYMFIGASPASTGGGVKTTTFLVLILVMISGAKGESDVVVRSRNIPRRMANRAVAILCFALLLISTAVFLILAIESDGLGKDISFNEALFECVSAFGTVGLSMGITAELSAVSKFILCFLMLCGRLGTISLGLVALGKKEAVALKYPDVKILIG